MACKLDSGRTEKSIRSEGLLPDPGPELLRRDPAQGLLPTPTIPDEVLRKKPIPGLLPTPEYPQINGVSENLEILRTSREDDAWEPRKFRRPEFKVQDALDNYSDKCFALRSGLRPARHLSVRPRTFKATTRELPHRHVEPILLADSLNPRRTSRNTGYPLYEEEYELDHESPTSSFFFLFFFFLLGTYEYSFRRETERHTQFRRPSEEGLGPSGPYLRKRRRPEFSDVKRAQHRGQSPKRRKASEMSF